MHSLLHAIRSFAAQHSQLYIPFSLWASKLCTHFYIPLTPFQHSTHSPFYIPLSLWPNTLCTRFCIPLFRSPSIIHSLLHTIISLSQCTMHSLLHTIITLSQYTMHSLLHTIISLSQYSMHSLLHAINPFAAQYNSLLQINKCLVEHTNDFSSRPLTLSKHNRRELGSGDSSVVRAPDSWSKGRRFESRQDRRENVFLHGQFSVLTLISVWSVPPRVTAVARKRSRPYWKKRRLQLSTHAPYVCGLEWSDIVNWCMAVWCTQNLRRDGNSFTWYQPCNNQ